MATVARDTSKRNSVHKNDSTTGVASAMVPTSADSGNITIGTVGNPGKSTTPKLTTGSQDAGSLTFASGQAAGNRADNWDSTFKQPTTE